MRKATQRGHWYLTWELDKSESASSEGVEGWRGGEGTGYSGAPVAPARLPCRECAEGTVQTWVLRLQPAGRIQPAACLSIKFLFCYFLLMYSWFTIFVLAPGVRASLVIQTVKNLPAMRETQVRFLGQEDPLEKGMATYSSILDRRMSWTEETKLSLSVYGTVSQLHTWICVFSPDFPPSVCYLLVFTQSCPALCDPMDGSTSGFPVLHHLRELKLMSIESVMPSNHLILSRPLFLLPSIFPSIRVFPNNMGYYTILNVVPYGIKQIFVVYLLYV